MPEEVLTAPVNRTISSTLGLDTKGHRRYVCLCFQRSLWWTYHCVVRIHRTRSDPIANCGRAHRAASQSFKKPLAIQQWKYKVYYPGR
jgi:hypothetical protein